MQSDDYKDHPLLPASAPKGQAHIIVGENFSSKYGLADFVATVLHNLEKHPNALKNFFDPDIKSFKFLRHYDEGKDDVLMQYMIWRKDKKVVAGFYELHNEGTLILWECLSTTDLSKVAPDATWTTTWAVQEAFSRAPMGTFWTEPFFGVNQGGYSHCKPHSKQEIRQVTRGFCSPIYEMGGWKSNHNSSIILETVE